MAYDWSGVALKRRVNLPQSEKMLFGENTNLAQSSIQDGAGMTLKMHTTK